jgi:hypothetical protein
MSPAYKHLHADDMLWKATNIDMIALQNIICAHFRAEYSHHHRMDDGSYARVFLFTLTNNKQVVARVILPIRESVKTEAEVAAMEVVRGVFPLHSYGDSSEVFLLTSFPSSYLHTRPTGLPILQLAAQPSRCRMGSNGIYARQPVS